MNDQRRFDAASEEAKRNLEEARRRLGGAGEALRPLARKAGSAFGSFRGWCSRNLPGGERTLWVAVGLVLLILFVWAILPGTTNTGFVQGGPQPVGVATAARGDIHVTLDALGTVTPLATVTVRPQVSGQILKFDFQEGQMVKAGDVLAEIDPRSYQAALDQAKGQLARDSAALANARLDLTRDQALYQAKATSQQTLDTQAALVKQDEGIVLSDRANVEAAAINLGYTRIASPVEGRVGIRQVDVGNFVSAGQTTGIVVVTELDPISVLFSVPEDNIDQIVFRMNSGQKLPVDAYDRAQTTKLASGTLSAVDTQVDTTTGTVKLRAMFDNKDGILFPNQFVNIRLLVNTLHRQVSVPASAIQRGAAGTFVFVVKSDHTVTMRTVTLGPQDGDRQSITKGLNAGETVVTDGADRLSEGSQVTIPSGQKVAKVEAAQNATPIPASAESGRRGAMFAMFRKLTPDEHKQVCAMNRDDRTEWMRSHRDELMKRPDQPGGGPCTGGTGGRTRAPRMHM
jgi:membrane fusion protein, multidrug efflux system